ncbi:MAG: EamA family transporter [Vulcanimicrobiaceae bacterium]
MPRVVILTLALLAVYIFWGSTAAAMRVAVATIPPFALAAIRFIVAGAMLWTYARLRGVPLPPAREWRDAAIAGALLLVLGNAAFAWVLQYLPSSLGALVFSLSPLWMAVLAATFDRERIAPVGIVGLLLGLIGMAYLLAPSSASHLPLVPVLVGVASSVFWAIGSLVQRRFPSVDTIQTSGMQMFVGGIMLSVIAPLAGEHLGAVEFTPTALGALGFLIVFGSLLGYSSYVWLFRNVGTTLASTYAYVNPIVAIAIGGLLLHETLTARTLVGAAVIIAGVGLMIAAAPAKKATSS